MTKSRRSKPTKITGTNNNFNQSWNLYLKTSSNLWRLAARKERPSGKPHSQSRTKDSRLTSNHSGTLSRSGMDTSRLVCQTNILVDPEQSMSCKKGGFVTLRHNTIRDMTAKMLSQVCKDVSVEPVLHPMAGETLTWNSTTKSDEQRLDIAARGFWVPRQKSFFDVRVSNPLAGRYGNTKIAKVCDIIPCTKTFITK